MSRSRRRRHRLAAERGSRPTVHGVAVVEHQPQWPRRDRACSRGARRARPGGVGGQHAADGALAPLAGSGAKRRPTWASRRSGCASTTPGCTRTVSAPTSRIARKCAAEIDDQAGAQRLRRPARAGAARHQRDVVLGGVAHQACNVFLVARHDHAERLDLEDAGVGAVEARATARRRAARPGRGPSGRRSAVRAGWGPWIFADKTHRPARGR